MNRINGRYLLESVIQTSATSKIGRVAGLFVSALLLICTPLNAQQVHTYTDRDSVRAGDVVKYTIVIEIEEGAQLIQLPEGESFESDDIDFIERERYRVSALRDSVIYTLQLFALEDTEIAGQVIEYLDSQGEPVQLRSLTVPLYFKSVLSEVDQEFRPLKPIFAFAASIWPWILLLVLLLIVGWIIYKHFQVEDSTVDSAPSRSAPPPFEHPADQLEQELSHLSGMLSARDKETRTMFYTRLGDAIRLYLKTVRNIDALEMTSGEIIMALRNHSAPAEIIRSSRLVFNEADMVKFARFEPDSEQMREALERGFEFLKQVRNLDHPKIEELRTEHRKKYGLETVEDTGQ